MCLFRHMKKITIIHLNVLQKIEPSREKYFSIKKHLNNVGIYNVSISKKFELFSSYSKSRHRDKRSLEPGAIVFFLKNKIVINLELSNRTSR